MIINNNKIFINSYNTYKPIINNINTLLTTLMNNFKSTSDIYIILQYLIKISNYMLIDIHNIADKYMSVKLAKTNLTDINLNISALDVFLNTNTNSAFNNLSTYFSNFQYDTNTINIKNTDIKNYITNMNKYVQDSKITLAIHYTDDDVTTIIEDIINIENYEIMVIFKYYFENDNIISFLIFLYIIIHYDISIDDTFKSDLEYIIFFLILFEQSYYYISSTNITTAKKYLKYYLIKFETIENETKKLLDKLKLEFTDYSYMIIIFDNIIKLLPIFKEEIITNVDMLKIPALNEILDKFKQSNAQTGGNKVIKDNIIDIRKTYDLYYSTNTDDLIIELLDVLGTNENVIYFLLIINTSLANFFEDLNQILIDFYNTDILLSYYYNENEIIYYIFLNYIYKNYKSLLSLSLSLSSSSKDIIINIGKIKTKENYNEIYKKLEVLFKNPEIISKLILFIKSHLEIPETIIHPKKVKDVEYLLLFIYKYSKKDEKVIKGYDSFLTYIYLNLLNKFNITPKIKIDNLPTFNLYNFTNLRKTYYFELSSNQEQLCIKLMKDIKLLISIISDRYRYIEHKTRIKAINEFVLNDEILDYLNIFGNDEIFKNYKEIPIIDLYILNKNVKIDINEIKEPTKQDNIIYNILLLASFLYKDNNKIPIEIYCKLVRHYFLIRNNKLLNDLTYELIYLMNKRIGVKIDIQGNLIKELSNYDIELSELKKFVEPEDRKINILELLEKLNISNYFKDNIELIIPYLLEFYKKDNKIQYSIQDLLSKQILKEKSQKLLMYGGNNDSIDNINDLNNPNNPNNTNNHNNPNNPNKSNELLNNILSDIQITELEKNQKKIDKLFGGIVSLLNIDKEFNDVIKLKITIPPKKEEVFDNFSDYYSDKFDKLSTNLIKYCTEEDRKTTPHSPESIRFKAELNNRSIQISKFKDKFINNYKKNYDKNKEEILQLYKTFEELMDKIKNQPELHNYPYIKEIYNLYIKDEDEKKNITYDIKEYFKDYENALADFESNLNDIIDKDKGKIPNLIKNLEEIIMSNNNKKYNNNNGMYGGGNIKYKVQKKNWGGAVNIEETNAKLKLNLGEKTKKMDNIFKNLKKLKENRNIDSSVEKKLATPGLFDNDGNNIFERLMTSYENDLKDKTMPKEIAKSLFYNKVKNNNLDPEIELDITLNDKLIFIGLIYCIRFSSLLLCEYLIKHDLITDINKSLFYYLIFYYVIFGILLLLINIDTFKMRILVNYMNLHISTTNIWMHLILMGCFVYLIYLLVVNILGEEKPPTELGDHEKIKLKYKLDLLTIIIYVFICILIFII